MEIISYKGKDYNKELLEQWAHMSRVSVEEFLERMDGSDAVAQQLIVHKNDLASAIQSSDKDIIYDANAKNVLSYTQIAARIVTGYVSEYKDVDPAEVFSEYLVGDIETGVHHIHIGQSDKIITGNSESKFPNEHEVYFDVRFRVKNPKPYNDKKIGIIINFEFQNDDTPGYKLPARGIYYTSRLISEQYGTIFKVEDYDQIEKVYSIWICPTSTNARKGTITRYRYTEEYVIGKTAVDREAYDLSEVILLYLPYYEDKTSDDTLNMLGTLFSCVISTDEKCVILNNDYHITMTDEIKKEVDSMLVNPKVYESEWKRKADAEIKKAREEKEESVVKLANKHLSIEDIADCLNLTVATVKEILYKRNGGILL